MAHVSVLVFGENPEKLIEAYDVNTTNPKYLEWDNHTHSVLYAWLNSKSADSFEVYSKRCEHYGWIEKSEDELKMEPEGGNHGFGCLEFSSGILKTFKSKKQRMVEAFNEFDCYTRAYPYMSYKGKQLGRYFNSKGIYKSYSIGGMYNNRTNRSTLGNIVWHETWNDINISYILTNHELRPVFSIKDIDGHLHSMSKSTPVTLFDFEI